MVACTIKGIQRASRRASRRGRRLSLGLSLVVVRADGVRVDLGEPAGQPPAASAAAPTRPRCSRGRAHGMAHGRGARGRAAASWARRCGWSGRAARARRRRCAASRQSARPPPRIGDVVRVSGFHGDAPTVRFRYRIGQLLNLRGEKTSEAALARAMRAALPPGAVAEYTAAEQTEGPPPVFIT